MQSGLTTPEQVRHKLRLMNTWIKLTGPDWTQEQLERYEPLFTTCARQGVEPNWAKIIPPSGIALEDSQTGSTAVKQTGGGNILQMPVSRKICRDCEQSKPLTDFNKRHDAKDGRYAFCKACAVAKVQAKRLAA